MKFLVLAFLLLASSGGAITRTHRDPHNVQQCPVLMKQAYIDNAPSGCTTFNFCAGQYFTEPECSDTFVGREWVTHPWQWPCSKRVGGLVTGCVREDLPGYNVPPSLPATAPMPSEPVPAPGPGIPVVVTVNNGPGVTIPGSGGGSPPRTGTSGGAANGGTTTISATFPFTGGNPPPASGGATGGARGTTIIRATFNAGVGSVATNNAANRGGAVQTGSRSGKGMSGMGMSSRSSRTFREYAMPQQEESSAYPVVTLVASFLGLFMLLY